MGKSSFILSLKLIFQISGSIYKLLLRIDYRLYNNLSARIPTKTPVSLAIKSNKSVCLPGIKLCNSSVDIAIRETTTNTIKLTFAAPIHKNLSFLTASKNNIDKTKKIIRCISLSLTLNPTLGKSLEGVSVPNNNATNQAAVAKEKYGILLAN